MESALDRTDDGRQPRKKQELKENEALARKLQEEDERMTKKAKTGDDFPARYASAAAAAASSSKRWADVEEEDDEASFLTSAIADFRTVVVREESRTTRT